MRKALLVLIGLVNVWGCMPYKSHLNSKNHVDGRTVFQRKTEVGLREAAAALSDSNHRGLAEPGTTLGLLALDAIVDQSCTDQPDGAVILIRSSDTSSFQMDTPEKNYKKDVFINAEVERSYTGGDDLECARKQPIIEVDLDRHLLTLKLAVKHRREEKTFLFEREKPDTSTATSTETEQVAAPLPTQQMSSISSLVEGSRTVTFTTDLGEVDDEVSYGKESVGKGQRTESVQSSDGMDTELHFTLESSFKMVDTYDEHPHDKAIGKGPLRKEVKTGLVKSVLAGQGSVETTFTDLRLEFTQGGVRQDPEPLLQRGQSHGGEDGRLRCRGQFRVHLRYAG